MLEIQSLPCLFSWKDKKILLPEISEEEQMGDYSADR